MTLLKCFAFHDYYYALGCTAGVTRGSAPSDDVQPDSNRSSENRSDGDVQSDLNRSGGMQLDPNRSTVGHFFGGFFNSRQSPSVRTMLLMG